MAWIVSLSRMASTASLSPLTTCRMPSGSPASCISSASISGHGRVALGRLEDEGVAAGDRRGHLPHRDHGGEVERRDARDHAERLAHGIHVDAGAGAVGELALQQMRRADAELDHLEPALHVALGVGEGLAMFAAERLGQLVHVAVEQAHELHHHARAALRVRGAPVRPAPSAAAATAASSSAFEASGTFACTSPVAGLKTSAKRPGRALDALAVDPVATVPAWGPPPVFRGRIALRVCPAKAAVCQKRFARMQAAGKWSIGLGRPADLPGRRAGGEPVGRGRRAAARSGDGGPAHRAARGARWGRRCSPSRPQGYALTRAGQRLLRHAGAGRAGGWRARRGRGAGRGRGTVGPDPDRRAGRLRELSSCRRSARAIARGAPGARHPDRGAAAGRQPVAARGRHGHRGQPARRPGG